MSCYTANDVAILLAHGNQSTATPQVSGLLNTGQVTLACCTQALTLLVRSQVTEGTVVGIANTVSSYTGIAFEEINHLLEHAIHFTLVAVHGARTLVVDASEFGDPHGFTVLCEMIEDSFDSVHVVLEDVNCDDLRLGFDSGKERFEPSFVLLHSHGGGDEFGACFGVRSKPLFPCGGGSFDRDDTGRTRAREIRLVEAHDERCGARLELLKRIESCPVIVVVDTSQTPKHGYGKDVATVRVVWVGSPVVVPAERLGSPLERVSSCNTGFAKRWGEAAD